jgi:hypothetical protein
MAKLKAGDKIYLYMYNNIVEVIHIGRIGKVSALSVCGKYRFQLDIDRNGYVYQTGKNRNIKVFMLETPELKKKIWRNNALDKIAKHDIKLLTDAQLKQILDVLR